MKKTVSAILVSFGLTVSLTACSQADEAIDHGREIVSRGQELVDLTVEKVKNFDFSQLQEYADTKLNDLPGITELMEAMPSGDDIRSIDVNKEDGKLVITYKDSATEVDTAVLDETMKRVSDEAKNLIDGLKSVEFHVGDEVYSF